MLKDLFVAGNYQLIVVVPNGSPGAKRRQSSDAADSCQ
jgi:hypothetical protein